MSKLGCRHLAVVNARNGNKISPANLFESPQLEEISLALYAIRGGGILLVALAHVIPGVQNRLIYLFHMPLFFILSGVGARQFPVKGIYRLFLRIKSLLIPGAVAGALITAPVLAVFLFNSLNKTWLPMDVAAHILYGAPGLSGAFSTFWFIPALSIIQIAAYLLNARVGRIWSTIIGFSVGVMAAALSFYCHDKYNHYIFRIIFGAAFGFQFFIFGYNLPLVRHRVLEILITAFAILTAFFAVRSNLTLDVSAFNYGVPVISSLISVVLSCSFMIIMAGLASIGRFVGHFLCCVGQSSIFVFIYHQSIHIAIAKFAPNAPLFLVLLGAVAPPVIAFQYIKGRFWFSSFVGAK